MDYALQVFQIREAFEVPYSVPPDDVLSDDGSFAIYPPGKPVIVSVEPGRITFELVSGATSYKLMKHSRTDYELLAVSVAPGTPVFESELIVAPGYYRVIAVNAVGGSEPSNTLYLAEG